MEDNPDANAKAEEQRAAMVKFFDSLNPREQKMLRRAQNRMIGKESLADMMTRVGKTNLTARPPATPTND